jgi:hypothetical protein
MFLGFDEYNHNYIIFKLDTNEITQSRTIVSHSNSTIDFDNNDWNQPFPVENDNNWIVGETNVPPIYDIFNNNEEEKKIRDEDEEEESYYDPDDYDIMGNPIQQQVVNNHKNENKLPRRSSRLNRQSVLSVEEINNILSLEQPETPQTYQEAMRCEDASEWKKSIQEEHQSLKQHQTFKIVPRTNNMKIIKAKYVFKIKQDEEGKPVRFKTRLVAKGYTQTQGIDFFETFAPTLRHDSLRFLLSMAAQNNFVVQHLDVQTAFLNGELQEEIFMEVPEALAEDLKIDRKKVVLKLNKSIYGLKQASRVWNEKFSSTIKAMGYQQSKADPCIFFKFADKKLVSTIGIFVDDCLLFGDHLNNTATAKQLMEKFKMHDLGPLTFALGIKVEQQPGQIKISQEAYVEKCLERFQMKDSKPCVTPLPKKPQADNTNNEPFEDINLFQSVIGSLIYLSKTTRPDIAYAVGYLARAMKAPTHADWMNAKRVLRYLKGTKQFALLYNNQQPLEGHSDSSYAEENDRKSVGGFVFKQAGAAITWRSTKQPVVAQSSMEAEYIALSEAGKEAQFIRKLQQEFHQQNNNNNPTIIFQDNQSSISLSENPIHSNRSKHIDVRYHAIRELIESKIVQIKYLPTEKMVADIMTKSLDRVLHQRFVKGLGLV